MAVLSLKRSRLVRSIRPPCGSLRGGCGKWGPPSSRGSLPAASRPAGALPAWLASAWRPRPTPPPPYQQPPLWLARPLSLLSPQPIAPGEELLVWYNGEDNPEIAAAIEEERASARSKRSSPKSRKGRSRPLPVPPLPLGWPDPGLGGVCSSQWPFPDRLPAWSGPPPPGPLLNHGSGRRLGSFLNLGLGIWA